jgi:hypothetical protein
VVFRKKDAIGREKGTKGQKAKGKREEGRPEALFAAWRE